MADTIHCYNPNEICEDCCDKTVQNIHIGELSDGKVLKLCNSCFKKRTEKK